ncbi:MAG: hypothetical protein HGA59_04130 [Chlorobiaceae bacterium]|nr:hypothetical protein [Chlorobiaceae bacterium]NTV17248.1 hypothetical protein [Chlorobiaceae bacterium]
MKKYLTANFITAIALIIISATNVSAVEENSEWDNIYNKIKNIDIRDFADYEHLALKTLELAKKNSSDTDRVNVAKSLEILSRVYIAKKQYTDAEVQLERSLQILEKSAENHNYHINNNLARTYGFNSGQLIVLFFLEDKRTDFNKICFRISKFYALTNNEISKKDTAVKQTDIDTSVTQTLWNVDAEKLWNTALHNTSLLKAKSGFAAKTINRQPKEKNIIVSNHPELGKGFIKAARLNYGAARIDFSKEIALNPESPYGYVYLGITKKLIRDDSGAKEDFSKAAEIDPENAITYKSLYTVNRENLKNIFLFVFPKKIESISFYTNMAIAAINAQIERTNSGQTRYGLYYAIP